MSFSKTFSEIANQGVANTEFSVLDGITVSTAELNALDVSEASNASATTFLRGDATWAAAGSTDASDLTSGTLPVARLPAGTVLQTKMIRYDDPISLTAAQPGGALTGVRLTITPISANSVLFMQWSIHQDTGHDNSNWRIYKDGAAITTAGYEGQSNYGTLNSWDIFSSLSDTSDAWSTPTTGTMTYYIKSGSTASQYYEPYSWNSAGVTGTTYINRTVGNESGAASYEHGVSVGIIQEIADGASTSVVL